MTRFRSTFPPLDEPVPPAPLPPPSWVRKVMTILWSAFLVAGVQAALVFVVVDPLALHWFGSDAVNWPVQAVYTVTFLIFWATTATAGALALWLYSPETL
jgi:hypothetical protein